MIWLLLLSATFSVDLTIDREQMTLDDSLVVSVEAHCPDGYALDRESLYGGMGIGTGIEGKFALIKEEATPLEGGSERITLTLEPWSTGEELIGLLPARFVTHDGSVVERYSDLLEVLIAPSRISEDERELAALLPYDDRLLLQLTSQNRARFQRQEEPPELLRDRVVQRQLPWRLLVLFLALTLLGLFSLRLMRKWRRATRPQERANPLSVALQALEELAKACLPEQQQFDPYYVRLTNIVRTYIEEAFSIRAPEQTTQEFLAEVARHPEFSTAMRRLLREFLSLADLVKFARVHPSIQECDQALEAAREFLAHNA